MLLNTHMATATLMNIGSPSWVRPRPQLPLSQRQRSPLALLDRQQQPPLLQLLPHWPLLTQHWQRLPFQQWCPLAP